MSLTASICYGAALALSGIYFIAKFRIKKYIFSPFMVSFMIYLFSFAISPRFYLFSASWLALGVTNMGSMRGYLDQTIVINGIGLLVTVSVMMIAEFRKKRVNLEKSIVYTMSRSDNAEIMKMVFWIVVALWYVIVYAFNGGIPLFNQGRAFYYNSGISPIYLALNEVILLYALYFGMRAIFNHSNYIELIIAIMTLLFTGNRGSVLTGTFLPIMIIYLYERQQRKNHNSLLLTNKAKRKAFKRIVIIIGITGVAGLALAFFRKGINNVTLDLIINELLNGNTFSDIRDGAYILRGMRNKFPKQFLWGKTYLAGILSFIPSSLSKFRTEWSFGRFTTMGLFNMSEHFGLRGGRSMEGYLNFGFPGVIISAIIVGWVYGYAEKMFNEIFLMNNVRHKGNEYLILYIIMSICSFFICTSATYNIYVDLIFLVIIANHRIRIVWKPPIWLDEDDGRATGIREENVSFAVFDTLIRRSVARPADLFRIMEQNDPRVPEHFAEKRMEAERTAFAKRGARMGLADIYEELLPLYGNHTNDLMALEIQYEIAGCRPVADNIDLVNLCMEHDKNVFLMADTYLPSSVLRRMLDVCGVYHYDQLYVSCEEGACKADGSLFWKVLADQEIRPHELRHIGSDRQGDVVEPWRVGVHVKRGKKKDQSAIDKDLPEDIALYERTLQSCVRNCADDLDSDDARLGCETFGPLLAGFTAWLREQLCRDGVQDVYFLAGDGAVLKQAFDALEDGAFRTHSLYFPVQTADQDHEALLAYLRACGMQGRVALVDTGRQAGVQKTLEQLIAEAGLAIQIKGYYMGLNPNAAGMQAAGYLYEPGKGTETLEKLSPIMAIFETIFHAQHGPVCRIAMRDGQPVPELDAYEYASDEGRICDEIAILRAYQAGALTLVREMNTAFPGGVPQIPGEAVLLPLLRMGTKPTLQEAELWGDFRVFRDGKATLMARPRGMGAYLLHPGQLKRDYAASPWKIGFLRRLSRLPLAYDRISFRMNRFFRAN